MHFFLRIMAFTLFLYILYLSIITVFYKLDNLDIIYFFNRIFDLIINSYNDAIIFFILLFVFEINGQFVSYRLLKVSRQISNDLLTSLLIFIVDQSYAARLLVKLIIFCVDTFIFNK